MRFERLVVGVDAERDDLRPSLDLSPERARGRPVDMARALGKNTNPTMSAPASSAASSVGGRGKAADFDHGRHRALLSVKAPALSKARVGT